MHALRIPIICCAVWTSASFCVHAQETVNFESEEVQQSSPSRSQREEIWMAVSDRKLEKMRGGFDVGGGLVVSVGLSLATTINGELVARTHIPSTQLTQLSTGQAELLRERLNSITLVQSGLGNQWGEHRSGNGNGTSVTQIPASGFGTVIQNTLNDQHIQHATIIDISSNASALLQSLSWQNTLRETLQNLGGVR